MQYVMVTLAHCYLITDHGESWLTQARSMNRGSLNSNMCHHGGCAGAHSKSLTVRHGHLSVCRASIDVPPPITPNDDFPSVLPFHPVILLGAALHVEFFSHACQACSRTSYLLRLVSLYNRDWCTKQTSVQYRSRDSAVCSAPSNH